MIAEFCQINPETGSWKAPHYPPTDVTRRYPRLFELWVREQTRRRDLRFGEEKDKETFEYVWSRDGEILDESRLATPEERVFIYWDAEEGHDVGFDWWGHRVEVSEEA